MINKKNLWFLTLFSLVLVLSIYYVTMPSELLTTNNGNLVVPKEDDTIVNITEDTIISALKVEDDSQVLAEISELKKTLTDSNVSVEDKNAAFDKLKTINKNSSKEETIEAKIKEEYQYDAFVKIDGDQVRVVIGTGEHDTTLANNIMKLVQNEFPTKMYISVKFQV